MEQKGDLDEKISMAMIVIFFGPSIILASATINNNSTSPNYTMLVAVYGVICVSVLVVLWKLLEKYVPEFEEPAKKMELNLPTLKKIDTEPDIKLPEVKLPKLETVK